MRNFSQRKILFQPRGEIWDVREKENHSTPKYQCHQLQTLSLNHLKQKKDTCRKMGGI